MFVSRPFVFFSYHLLWLCLSFRSLYKSPAHASLLSCSLAPGPYRYVCALSESVFVPLVFFPCPSLYIFLLICLLSSPLLSLSSASPPACPFFSVVGHFLVLLSLSLPLLSVSCLFRPRFFFSFTCFTSWRRLPLPLLFFLSYVVCESGPSDMSVVCFSRY